jgi:Sec-independent protein translocase protein TatA
LGRGIAECKQATHELRHSLEEEIRREEQRAITDATTEVRTAPSSPVEFATPASKAS